MDQSSSDFVPDIQTHLTEYFADLELLRKQTGAPDAQLLASIFRRIHTIKGSAVTPELAPIALIAHQVENLLAAVREGKIERTDATIEALGDAGNLISSILSGHPPANEAVSKTLDQIAAQTSDYPVVNATYRFTQQLPVDLFESLTSSQKAQIEHQCSEGAQLFTISTLFEVDDFDQKFIALTQELEQLGSIISTHPRTTADRPGEISFKLLLTSTSEPGEIASRVRDFELQIESVGGEPNRAVQQELSHESTLDQLFKRAVRIGIATADSENKKVSFETSAANVVLKRDVAVKIMEALVHLVRNAVAHGIESADERMRLGKQAAGSIRLHAEVDESGLIIKVQDDGRGIDYKRVAQAAMTMGLVPKEAELSAEQCLDLIFEPGLSTLDSVNLAAGRGIGLDAVRTSVNSVDGDVHVFSGPGKETVFEIFLPKY